MSWWARISEIVVERDRDRYQQKRFKLQSPRKREKPKLRNEELCERLREK